MALDWRHADTDPKQRNNLLPLFACVCVEHREYKPPDSLKLPHTLLLYLNQTSCPWNSPWFMAMGLITGTSSAHFKATLTHVHLEMSWLLFSRTIIILFWQLQNIWT